MRVIAIDPGTSDTGLIYMDELHVLDAKTLHFNQKIGSNQRELAYRAGIIADSIDIWMVDRPHDAVVIEGFTSFGGQRQNASTYQTPYLCGYLGHLLAANGETVEVQTSAKVLNPHARGSFAKYKEDMKCGKRPIEGAEMATNDHLRSALTHGLYYLHRKRLWGVK